MMKILNLLILAASLGLALAVHASPSKLSTQVQGEGLIWTYLPLMSGVQPNMELYSATLDFDADRGPYGFHIEPHFRDSKLRSFYTSNVWLEEAYGSYAGQGYKLKFGKEYVRFGKFWDGSFYGNIQYNDGLKLSADQGLSFESRAIKTGRFKMPLYAQFFLLDGRSNGSQADHDTISVPNAHKRDEAVLRAVPTVKVGNGLALKLGLSAQSFDADLATAGIHQVTRLAGDVTLASKAWGQVYFEWTRQMGQSVVDFPFKGRPSKQNTYLLAGVQTQAGAWSFYYNYSYVDYHDVHVTQDLQVPGIIYQLDPGFSLIGEYAYWQQKAAGAYTKLDSSLNFVLDAKF